MIGSHVVGESLDLDTVQICALEAEVLVEFLNLKQENLELKNPNIKHLNYLNIGESKLTHEEVEGSMNKTEHASAVHTREKQHVSKNCEKCFCYT